MHTGRIVAFKLRKAGKSYTEIERTLHIPRSTLSEWFSNLAWSKNIEKRYMERTRAWRRSHMHKVGLARANLWRRKRAAARQEARETFKKYARDPLFVAGLMLYWGEGDSKIENGNLRITNTHPAMIMIFKKFLQKYCDVSPERFKLYLLLYPDLDEKMCQRYWMKHTGIARFGKSQILAGRHPTKRLTYGISILPIGSCEIKEMVLEWLDLYRRKLLR